MGIADVFGNIGKSIGGMFSRVFGPTKSGIPTTVEESGVDFDYPIIYIPGPPNHNSQRDRSVNDAALPFSPEEYKKIYNEIYDRKDLNMLTKDEMMKQVLKSNPKWVPGQNIKPKEELKPSSSAIRSLRITPDNKIAIRYGKGSTEYTYTGGQTVKDAAKEVLKLINSQSIGRELNTKIPGSWGARHFDHGHG